jgi:hypothetical protein
MTEGQDAIVVYRQFDSVIEANVAKTKLDAYDIPCFLTNENMAGLYPGQQALHFFNIRLHVFRKDMETASRILMERQDSTGHGDLACPKCDSRNVQRDFPKRFSFKPLTALAMLFFGVLLPHQKINHCLECDYEF